MPERDNRFCINCKNHAENFSLLWCKIHNKSTKHDDICEDWSNIYLEDIDYLDVYDDDWPN
jgi:hypothetical protein